MIMHYINILLLLLLLLLLFHKYFFRTPFYGLVVITGTNLPMCSTNYKDFYLPLINRAGGL